MGGRQGWREGMSGGPWEAACGCVGQWLGTDCRRGLEAFRVSPNPLPDGLVSSGGHGQPQRLAWTGRQGGTGGACWGGLLPDAGAAGWWARRNARSAAGEAPRPAGCVPEGRFVAAGRRPTAHSGGRGWAVRSRLRQSGAAAAVASAEPASAVPTVSHSTRATLRVLRLNSTPTK